MANVHFRCDDGRFGLQIEQKELDRMREHCAKWKSAETGGILVGHYNDERNCAIATKAALAPKDSKRGRTWFVRGLSRLQEWIQKLWAGRGEYYLGEWHYHPGGPSAPSWTDSTQMMEIAQDSKYGCPEPILVIVAQPRPGQWEVGAYAFPKEEGQTTLQAAAH